MKQGVTTALAVGVALCTAGFAAAQSSMSDDKMGAMGSSMGGMTHTIKLNGQHDSGESGTATLTQTPAGLVVKLKLTGGSGDQPAHIHKGTCAKLDPKPAYPLDTVMDGKSTTTLKDVKLSTVMSGTYAINVHKSTAEIQVYVACGDLSMTK